MGIVARIKKAVMTSAATKIATAAAVIALVGGGTVGLVYAGGFAGAKTAVGLAVINTLAGQFATYDELSSEFKKQGGELLVELSGQEVSLDKLGLGSWTLPKADIRFVAKSNAKEEWNASLELRMSDTAVLTGNAYLNKEQLQVNVPKLFKAVLTAKHNGAAVAETITGGALSKELPDIVTTAYKKYLADTELKKGGKEEISTDGVVQNCRTYTAEMDAEAVTGFLDEVTAGLKTCVKKYCREHGIEETMADEAFSTWEGAVQQWKVNLKGKVTWKFYIYKERLVCLKAAWNIERVDENGSSEPPGNVELILIPQDDSLSLQVSAEEQEWNATISLKAMKTEVAPLSGPQQDMLSMTEADVEDLKEEIGKNLTKLMFNWIRWIK